MTISPWAMLMTPITPKVMARPIAASSSTEPSDRPYQAFCTQDHIASLLWIAAIALAAACATAGGWSAPRSVNIASASWSPRALTVAMASSFSASVASSLNSTIAARASLKACFASLFFSFCNAASIAGSRLSSWFLKTDCAAWIRLSGSGDCSVSAPSAASTPRRSLLLTRTAAALSGMLVSGAPVAASMILPSGWVT